MLDKTQFAVLAFHATAFHVAIFGSPIRDAKNCSLLVTEGEATGVSVGQHIGDRIVPKGQVPDLFKRTVRLGQLVQFLANR